MHFISIRFGKYFYFSFQANLDVINLLFFIYRFQAPDLEVKLSDELAGSLRQLKVLNKPDFSYSVRPLPIEEMLSFICNEFWFIHLYYPQHSTLYNLKDLSWFLALKWPIVP